MRFCKKCNDMKMCDICNNQINENKEFEANLNELKRYKPHDCGHMLPYYVIKKHDRRFNRNFYKRIPEV